MRLRRLGLALLIALAVSLVVLVVQDRAPIGDYPVFHVAGELAREDLRLLLDADEQSVRLAQWYGSSIAPFAYPPLVALAFVPLSMAPLGVGYGVFVVLMAAMAATASWLLSRWFGVSPPWRHVAIVGTLTYPPVVRSVVGGQNATLTLLVLVGGWVLLARERWALAGIVLGVLWFKPQFAIPILLLVLVARWYRTAVGMAAVGVGFSIIHTILVGGDWFTMWIRLVADRGAANRVGQVGKTISPVQYVGSLFDAGVAEPVTYALAIAVGALFAFLMLRQRGLADRLVIACLALMLASPHALAYEATLLVPVIGLCLCRGGPPRLPVALACWAAGVVALLPGLPLLRIAYLVLVAAWWWSTMGGHARGAPAVEEGSSPIPASPPP